MVVEGWVQQAQSSLTKLIYLRC